MSVTHKRVVGDLRPINGIIFDVKNTPRDISSDTIKFEMETESGTSVIAATATGITKQPTQSFTASSTTELLTSDEHGVQQGDQIKVASSGTLPSGLSASVRYFAVNVLPNSFSLSTQPGGTAIDLADTGTGTHTFYIIGSWQYQPLIANFNTAGFYRAWLSRWSGSDVLQTYPNDESGIIIQIVNKGN